jgi:hypothetical protein
MVDFDAALGNYRGSPNGNYRGSPNRVTARVSANPL